MTAEQKARDLLSRIGVPDAQSYTAGDLCELANLIAFVDRLTASRPRWEVGDVIRYTLESTTRGK